MKTENKIYAIIPAAGKSGRMGRLKQAMPINGEPMLKALLQKLTGQVETTIIVTQKKIAEQLQLTPSEQTQILFNDNPGTEMIDSIRLALHSLRSKINQNDAILIEPVDQPAITIEDIQHCSKHWQQNPEAIIIGTSEGQRGHPLIFPASLIDFALSAECDNGLNALPRQHPEKIQRVELPSGSALQNLNHPEDYDSITNPK